MTRYAQNGWTAVEPSQVLSKLSNFPYVTGKVRKGDALTIFTHLAEWYEKEIEPIRKAWSWGYNYRVVRNGVSLSNHAAGMAVDFNAPKHPLGVRGTFSASQRNKIVSKMKAWGGVVRWGGIYSGRADEMHFEIIGSAKQVRALANSLNGAKPAPKPPKPQTGKYPAIATTVDTRTDAWYVLMGKSGFKDKSSTVRRQKWLRELGYYSGKVDGKWGPATAKALQAFLKHKGLYKGLVDGKAGAMTRNAEVAYLNDQRKYIK